jgi:hypothetical protein
MCVEYKAENAEIHFAEYKEYEEYIIVRSVLNPEIPAKMPPGSKTFNQLNMFETAWLEFKRFWGIK